MVYFVSGAQPYTDWFPALESLSLNRNLINSVSDLVLTAYLVPRHKAPGIRLYLQNSTMKVRDRYNNVLHCSGHRSMP